MIKYVFTGLLAVCGILENALGETLNKRGHIKENFPIKLINRGTDTNYAFLGIKDSSFVFDPVLTLRKFVVTGNHYSAVSHAIEIGGSNIQGIRLNSFETPKLILTLTKVHSINLYDSKSYSYAFTNDTIDVYDMHEMKISNFNLTGSLIKKFFSSYNQISSLQVAFTNISEKFSFDHCTLNKVSVNNSIIHELNFREVIVYDDMHLKDCNLQKDSYISGVIKRNLLLENLTFDNNTTLDLRNCRKGIRKINLFLRNVPVENLQIDWRNFTLDSATRADYSSCKATYMRLLENFSKHFQTESYELADKEYQTYQYLHFGFLGSGWLFDKFIWLWWDYGYSGWQVILWMILLPFIWALIAYKHYDKLQEHVYKVDHFTPFRRRRRSEVPNRTFGNSLIYVSVIFFTVSVKLDKIKFERRWLLIFFLTIYLNGICCMYFLIHYLLKG
ncbi:hypothetical protein [Mucilaginibacter jinjuensis]|uniref:Pentapeptide repeat protein n=1 Tax=Mucilaginibacter jinjuensis TaxID=1176721 RepID=A0ABY7TBP7_9SPHI|nr:hypothetical protein [Mucilaginibacter jinjuensis]WCT13787.1 hypothetical protein PQO05_07545 [Mucilaginibacter jinjuensis]